MEYRQKGVRGGAWPNPIAPRAPFPGLGRLGRLVLLAWLGLALLYGGLAWAQETPPEPVPPRWLVGVSVQVRAADVVRQIQARGWRTPRAWPEFGVIQVEPPVGNPTADAETALAGIPGVRFVEPDRIIRAAVASVDPLTPDDPFYAQQWGMERIRMPEAWGVTKGTHSVLIALVDSGFDATHEDLVQALLWTNPVEAGGQPGVDDDDNGLVDDLHGWDYVEDDPDPQDAFGHGTHVGGTLVAGLDNHVGVAGIGPGVRLLPLRVLDGNGVGYVSDLLDALAYARRAQAQVINLSLVLRTQSLALESAVDRAYRDGILVVAATGNYGSQVYWPAAYTQTLAVAATDSLDQRAPFSNAGPETDLAAPGMGILSTAPDNGYKISDGTSMATPHVAGVAGLILSLRPDLRPISVTTFLTATAVDVNADQLPGPDPELGWGRLDAGAALARAAADVNLTVERFPAYYIGVGEPISVSVRLWVTDTKGMALPVAGARVGYVFQRLEGGEVAPGSSQLGQATGFTDETGQVHFYLTAPETAGTYNLLIRFADRSIPHRIPVQDGPLVVSAWTETPTGVTAGNATAVWVEVRRPDGGLYTDPLPVRLETDRGRWPNGQRVYERFTEEGRLRVPLQVGTQAGPGKIQIQVENQHSELHYQVTPDRPTRIQGPVRVVGYGRDNPVRIPLRLTLVDRYGNPTPAGTVHFYTPELEIPSTATAAADGTVQIEVAVPSWAPLPQPIWATLPGTLAVHRVEVYVYPFQVWMPVVAR